jgi:hypothetical protein
MGRLTSTTRPAIVPRRVACKSSRIGRGDRSGFAAASHLLALVLATNARSQKASIGPRSASATQWTNELSERLDPAALEAGHRSSGSSALASGMEATRNVAHLGSPSNSNRQDVDTHAFAGPLSATMSEPLTVVGIHARAGHLLLDLRSPEGSVRMQLTRRDIPVTRYADSRGSLNVPPSPR